MSISPRRLLLVAALAGLVSTASFAGVATVDQFLLEGNQTVAIQSGSYISQSFVPQVAGYLAGVEVSLDLHPAGQNVHAEVWSDGLRVGMAVLTPADEGPFHNDLQVGAITATYIDFTPFAIPTSPGFALELRFANTVGLQLALIRRDTLGGYDAGSSTIDGVGAGGDLVFKTFVQPTVPLGTFDHFQPDGVAQAVALTTSPEVGQTMTVLSSGRLAGLELSLDAPAGADDDLSLLFYRHGTQGASLIGSLQMPAQEVGENDIPFFLRHAEIVGTFVDLTSLEASVSAGEIIEVRFHTTNTVGFYSARRATANVYAGGTVTSDGSPTGGDLAFKLFVEADVIFVDGFETGNTSSWN